MATTSELRDALGKYGACRLQLQAVWGVWADDFCDSLLLRLPEIRDNTKIHLWVSEKIGTQVNIDIGLSGGYTVDHTDDPLKIIGERLGELVRSSDASEEGTGSQVLASKEELRSVPARVRKAKKEAQDDPAPVSGLFIHEV